MILDSRMPDTSGIDLAAAIEQGHAAAKTQIIMLTTAGEHIDVRHAGN